MRESTQKLRDAIAAEIGTFGHPTTAQAALIERVEAEFYHDFFGEPDEPMGALRAHALAAGLPGIAERVVNGDFDATKAEADEWMASSEGRDALHDLLNGLGKRSKP